MSAFRPRLARSGQRIDEKMAAFFVDKAIRAVADDIAADTAIERAVKLHGHSLGNAIGQQRFIDRMTRNAGPSTLYLMGHAHKKHFLLIRDFVTVAKNSKRILITRSTIGRHPTKGIGMVSWEPFVISRHALIRAVQWAEISSVEDVFLFLKVFWLSQERFFLTLMHNAAVVTKRLTCWAVPAMLGHKPMAMMIRRVAGTPPALVTVYPPERIPDRMLDPMAEFLAALENKALEGDEQARDDALVAILPRLVA